MMRASQRAGGSRGRESCVRSGSHSTAPSPVPLTFSSPVPDDIRATVLLATPCFWTRRALEEVLRRASYSVARAADLDAATIVHLSGAADALIVDERLDAGGTGPFAPRGAMPMLYLTRQRLSDAARRNVHRAGYWGFLEYPLGTSAWVEQLGVWVAAARAGRAGADAGLVDRRTGLYNERGLAQRARELDAAARRRDARLACAVFAVEPAATGSPRTPYVNGLPLLRHADAPSSSADEALAEAVRRVGRASDVFGRVGASDFAVLATDTDAAGLRLLLARLARVLADVSRGMLALRVLADAPEPTLDRADDSAMALVTRTALAAR